MPEQSISETITAKNPLADEAIDVGVRLRMLRAGAGLSIRALAELSGLNVNTLSLIENGKTSPSVSNWHRGWGRQSRNFSRQLKVIKPLYISRVVSVHRLLSHTV